MEIVNIFATYLYAFRYDNIDNEYRRLIKLWTDTEYVKKFAEDNNIKNKNNFIDKVAQDADDIDDFLKYIVEDGNLLGDYFAPYNDSELGFKILSLQKGKKKQSNLRIYAIKIAENLFVITGGAIKITQTTQEHQDTKKEHTKLKQAKQYLESEGVFDEETFYELLNSN